MHKTFVKLCALRGERIEKFYEDTNFLAKRLHRPEWLVH
jgi:hypothetical protein